MRVGPFTLVGPHLHPNSQGTKWLSDQRATGPKGQGPNEQGLAPGRLGGRAGRVSKIRCPRVYWSGVRFRFIFIQLFFASANARYLCGGRCLFLLRSRVIAKWLAYLLLVCLRFWMLLMPVVARSGANGHVRDCTILDGFTIGSKVSVRDGTRGSWLQGQLTVARKTAATQRYTSPDDTNRTDVRISLG